MQHSIMPLEENPENPICWSKHNFHVGVPYTANDVIDVYDYIQ
jgi:hypothetical protein